MKFLLLLILLPFLALASGEVYSPNMNLPIPAVGVTKGPAYATDINNALLILDKHNHTPGYGVPITPSGMNITSDLTMQSNNLLSIRALRFTVQGSAIPNTSPDIGELYSVGGELYYNDTNGHQVPITSGGSVTGASGTITGLPSGTASAAFVSSSGTFRFQQSSGTGANIDAGTYVLRYPGSYPSPTGNYIALQAPSALATGYALTFPTSVPSSQSFVTIDNSGTIAVGIPTAQGITGSNIASATIAGSNIASATVTGSNIASATITGSNIASNTIPNSALAGIVSAVSSGSGTFSHTGTTPVQVTNLSVSITTTGRPVMIMLQGATNGANIGFAWNGTGSQSAVGYLQVQRNGTDLGNGSAFGNLLAISEGGGVYQLNPVTTYYPPASFTIYDNPNAGTYTYTIFTYADQAGGVVSVNNCKLFVYEL